MRSKNWIYMVVVLLLVISCNLPSGAAPTPAESPQPSQEGIGTAIELTTAARMTESAASVVEAPAETATFTPVSPPTETLSPTPCTPLATSTANANVRSGPDTAYDVVGYLELGKTAEVAGRNDENTWWYIKYAGASGGHAWIAGSVVTTSCLPSVVQVVEAPPLPPTPTPTNTEVPPVVGDPDLVASAIQWSGPAHKNQALPIQVQVTNSGNAAAGQFTVVWLSNQDEPGCDWVVSGLAAGKSKILECTFTYTYKPASTSTFWVTLEVDTGGDVDESNEGNNSQSSQITVQP